ncbi:MAG: hypothetical protein ACYCST_17800 [Acidimicrobiales bacterium]
MKTKTKTTASLAAAVSNICRVAVSAAGGYEEACPACGEVLLRERDGRLDAPHGPFYFDGDTIPGAPSNDRADIVTAWYALEVGRCAHCGADLAQIKGEHASRPVDVGAWHCLTMDTPRRHFVVDAERSDGPPLRWLLTEFRVGDWRRSDHSIGPLLLSARDASSLHGQYGVGACSGGGQGVWQRAARVSQAMHPWMRRCLELIPAQ